MLARRIVTILPDVTFNEALDITKIHSIYGDANGIITQRPFRSPHHTITQTALVGGGRNSSPGEISLAHNGVLFLDEFTEFKRQCLEVLREPLEDKEVVISRVNYNLRYPCNFMLIASMNPCPCGYLGSAKRKCTCKQYEINRYIKKISGPLIDRIDLMVNVFDIEYSDINNNDEESSEEIKKRVNIARNIQINRYKNESICSNSQLTGKMINEYCKIDDKGQKIMGQLFNKYNLTMRSYTRILKVARTIADLKQREDIKYDDIIEAAQYKCQEWR